MAKHHYETVQTPNRPTWQKLCAFTSRQPHQCQPGPSENHNVPGPILGLRGRNPGAEPIYPHL